MEEVNLLHSSSLFLANSREWWLMGEAENAHNKLELAELPKSLPFSGCVYSMTIRNSPNIVLSLYNQTTLEKWEIWGLKAVINLHPFVDVAWFGGPEGEEEKGDDVDGSRVAQHKRKAAAKVKIDYLVAFQAVQRQQ